MSTTCEHPASLRDVRGQCAICPPGDAPEPTHATNSPEPRRARRGRAAAIERRLLTTSLADFAARFWPVVTGAPYVPNAISERLIAALQGVADGKVTRLLVAMPPGVGKSTTLALYAAWRLARDPSWRSIHAGHAFELAATESRRVRRLVESDEFQAMFSIALRTDESTVAHWATVADGRYIAVGTDGALTGRRAHEAVCDDPLNATDRFSKAAREGLWAWFNESLSTRLDGDRAPMIVVQQRLDRDDLIGRLIEAGGWDLVEIPAEDEAGNASAPNVLPREKLDALKAQIGAATYACQYLQRPASDEGARVRRTWWRFHHPVHIASNTPRPSGCDTTTPAVPTPERYDRIVVAVDMTFGTTTASADYAVIQAWGSVGPARYLIEQWRQRATQAVQRAAIKDFAKRYPGARILVEKAAGGAGAIEELHAEGLYNVHPVTTAGRGKTERISVVTPTIENGFALIALGAAWLGEFVEELAGASKHDDSQDCVAYALHELNTGNSAEAEEAAAHRARYIGLVLSSYDGASGKSAVWTVNQRMAGCKPPMAPLSAEEIAASPRLHGTDPKAESARGIITPVSMWAYRQMRDGNGR